MIQYIVVLVIFCHSFAHANDDIEKYKNEAKNYIGSNIGLDDEIKKIPGFTHSPKEQHLSELELRTSADDKMRGHDNSGEEKHVIGAVKSSYTENPHRSKHTAAKLQNKDFIRMSDAITSNPISGLNVVGEADCKISDKKLEGENVRFEEYWVDVEDTQTIEGKYHCEEDEDRLFYCNRTLKKVSCISQVQCSFDNPDGEGGLYTSDSNNEFMNASGGMSWSYSGDILSFGDDSDYLYGSIRSSDDRCHRKEFTANFFIKDKSRVSEFKIIKIHENNLLNISINGILIRNGVELGGGNCWHNAGKTTWDDWDFDLKPYLKEGWNSMHIDLRYTKGGHTAIKMRAKQYCCNKWSEEWESDCPVE